MTTTAISRFGTLVMVAYVFGDKERARLRDARREQFSRGVMPDELFPALAA